MVHRIPRATYRLQFHTGFTLSDAEKLVPYLHRLGISDIYLSPVLSARAGSEHGYDVTDPTEINPAIGGDSAFDQLSATARDHEMGLLLDIVPNHMAASTQNPWWLDVLRNGPDSRYARFFDIDWDDARREGLKNRVLLPVLGKHYLDAIEDGEIQVVEEHDEFWVAYFDWRFPISPSTGSRQALDNYLNASGDSEQRIRALDRLLAAQSYQLAYWRSGSQEINYRRFFDINDLVAMRVENPLTFDELHKRVFRLTSDGRVTSLRIDHVDGLWDPKAYLDDLRAAVARDSGDEPYIVVEKILSGAEPLPGNWEIAGTTGYDFLNVVNGALTEGQNADALDRLFQRLTDDVVSFHALVYQEKLNVIRNLFQADLNRIVQKFLTIADRDRYGRDLAQADLAEGIAQLTASLPVYRIYIRSNEVASSDRDTVTRTIAAATRRSPDLELILRFLRRVILFENGDELDETGLQQQVDAVMSWQQFTGPVMAKGLEDTSLYVDTRLVSLNAVGGEPDVIEVSVDDLHAWARNRAESWPHSMNATSTHDSKRSEDVRARISVLSQIPDLWEQHVEHWMAWNSTLKTSVDENSVPEPRTELLIYQTLLGVWPLDDDGFDDLGERMKQYMIKATREAKRWTSWVDQNAEYEDGLEKFIDKILAPQSSDLFLRDFRGLQEIIAFHGALNSLTQTLLKYTLPGVPDLYQGCELWDFSLVDPDNRRPVDYGRRREALDRVSEINPGDSPALLANWRPGAIKMYFIKRALDLRRQMPDVFESGSYQPIQVDGELDRHVIVFGRSLDSEAPLVVVVPRLTATLARSNELEWDELPVGDGAWGNTSITLPAGSPRKWRNILCDQVVEASGESVGLGEVFQLMPYAMLVQE